jgi:iron complex outermembrane receptor protein
MNDSQTGHNTFNIPFDISAVERIEIMKGSSAKLYGQNVSQVSSILLRNLLLKKK